MSTAANAFKTLLTDLSTALRSFQSSGSKFTVVHSINKTSRASPLPQTLFILDSSFNPPQKAHLAIARSALQPGVLSRYPSPYRLLLLFSTSNADKAPSPAPFETRLALMALFASDLASSLPSQQQIDIGLTTEPFYNAKSAAISRCEGYLAPGASHVHLMGFDTVTRFLAPKYYKDHDPPLSALEPFFNAGHKLRVTLRPEEGYGSIAEQKAFFERLSAGETEDQGGRREWAKQIDTVEAGEGTGISSTVVRAAARNHKWDEVQRLTPPSVAEAIRQGMIYE